MKYIIRNYPNGRLLEFKHADGCKIYGSTLSGLIETIAAYNRIYYK
jgi:hypothetical protein